MPIQRQQIEYLGHLISNQGVATDPAKIDCMLEWPRLNSLKALILESCPLRLYFIKEKIISTQL